VSNYESAASIAVKAAVSGSKLSPNYSEMLPFRSFSSSNSCVSNIESLNGYYD